MRSVGYTSVVTNLLVGKTTAFCLESTRVTPTATSEGIPNARGLEKNEFAFSTNEPPTPSPADELFSFFSHTLSVTVMQFLGSQMQGTLNPWISATFKSRTQPVKLLEGEKEPIPGHNPSRLNLNLLTSTVVTSRSSNTSCLGSTLGFGAFETRVAP